jgi:predicted ferric reductase
MKKRLFIFIYLLTPVLLTLAIYLVNPARYNTLWGLGSMALGTFAYSWIQWQFIISSRPRWLERNIGMDFLYRFHGIMALVSIGLGFIHGQWKEQVFSESFLTSLGSNALIIFAGVSVISLVLMVSSKLHKVKAIRILKSAIYKNKLVNYEILKKFHNITIIGLLLVVAHVLMTSQVRQSFVSFTVYMVPFVISFGHYVYHKMIRSWILTSTPLRVESIDKIQMNSGNQQDYIWHIHMLPKRGKVQYKPGQFAFFRFPYKKGLQEHPFTIASSPSDNRLTVSVKNLGDFTKDLGGLKAGDEIIMDGPYGAFSYLEHPEEKGILFFAAGIGITPAMSMIRHMRAKQELRPITLVWQLRTLEEAVFLEELESFAGESDHFKVQIYLDGAQIDGSLVKQIAVATGKLNKNIIKGHLELNQDTDHFGFYLCGPAGFMTMVKDSLDQLGVSKKQVHSESFSF